MFLECKEFWFDSISRQYRKRRLAINPSEINSYYEFYSTEIKRDVVRVCLKDGRYHDIDESFDSFSEDIIGVFGYITNKVKDWLV